MSHKALYDLTLCTFLTSSLTPFPVSHSTPAVLVTLPFFKYIQYILYNIALHKGHVHF